jgi:hypothetical protein
MTPTIRHRVLALCLALAALLAGCASKPAAQGKPDDPSSRPKTTLPSALPNAYGSPVQKEFSDPNVAAPPVASREAKCPELFRASSPQHPENSSWIVAIIDTERDFGRDCPRFAAGADCWIPFAGGWKLRETPTGSVVFQVFENDSTKPVRSPEIGPVPSGGQFSQSTKLHYVVGKTAKKVTFRAILKDAAGRVAAQSEPQTVSVPICFASR